MKLFDLLHSDTERRVDKWTANIIEYDRIFPFYKDKAISILEIGVMGGGSLELWSKYFQNAALIMGVDINPACGLYHYDDERVSVIVGDATDSKTIKDIRSLANEFDIIIDDGSHQSPDIVSAFAAFFPMLRDDGIYVIEDLHCSYWKEFDGGLRHPRSAIAFLKALVDVINAEHFGTGMSRLQSLAPFELGDLTEDDLKSIHSITFSNSLCTVQKKQPQSNTLGPRIISGPDKAGNGTLRSVQDQSGNVWS